MSIIWLEYICKNDIYLKMQRKKNPILYNSGYLTDLQNIWTLMFSDRISERIFWIDVHKYLANYSRVSKALPKT